MPRLIDADALMEKLMGQLRVGEVLYRIPPDAIDNAPTIEAPQWIPVTERLPENNTTVLVYRPKMVKKVMTSYYFNRWCEGAWDIHGNEVITHWMPLPKPPEEEVQND